MAANIRSGTIAALASLFIVAPLPSDDAASRTPQVVAERTQPNRPIVMPSFPVPTLRTIEVSYAAPALLGFAGRLEPIAIAEDTEVVAMRGSLGPDAKTPTETLEFPQLRPSVPVAQVLAALNLAQPAPKATQLPEPPLEEFPGAVAVAVPRLAANAKWRRIVDERPASLPAVSCADISLERCASSPWNRWHDLVRKVSALGGEERLQAANEGINALLTYANDEDVYGVGDHWATLQESMARGRGDCEDIAIAKMWLLNAAGVDLANMRLVVLKDTLRNLDHAVLSVVEDGHQYVLDNTAWKVGRADWMRGYRPIYALSVQQSWIYGMRTPVTPPLQVAQNAAPALPQ